MAIAISEEPLFSIDGESYNYKDLFVNIKESDYTEVGETDFNVFEGVDLVTNQKAAIITFQSTNWSEDLKTDLSCCAQSVKAYSGWENKLKYHKGFFLQYHEARDTIINMVSSIKANSYIVAGWSLGGALATICAEDIKYHFGVKPVLIVYESPNVCSNNATVKAIYNSIDLDRSIAFVNGDDLVPHLPFFPFTRKLKNLIVWLKYNKKGVLIKKPHFNIFKCLFNLVGFHVDVDKTLTKYFEEM